MGKTANDIAWDAFLKARKVKLDGKSHRVTADDLKRVTGREPRLLAKFDSPSQLPRPLRDAGYCVLPISNGTYLLFSGDIFHRVQPCAKRATRRCDVDFPLITSGRGSGESEYLDHAFNCGALSHFLGTGRLYQTIRGRQRASAFSCELGDLLIDVDGCQMEIDGGYEGANDIVLVEAKIGAREFFNVRQLYFPYRHFVAKTRSKNVRPVYFEYDVAKATYTFREYTFTNQKDFSSIVGRACCTYTIDTISSDLNIDSLLDDTFITGATNVPQADDLNKVLELLTIIDSGIDSVPDIADHFVFDKRQSNYYGEAAEYLGFIRRARGTFSLTARGSEFLHAAPGLQRFILAKAVINSWVFRQLLARLKSRGSFDDHDIAQAIAAAKDREGNQRYTSSTLPRRRQTIHAWLKWLASELDVLAYDDGRYMLPRSS